MLGSGVDLTSAPPSQHLGGRCSWRSIRASPLLFRSCVGASYWVTLIQTLPGSDTGKNLERDGDDAD